MRATAGLALVALAAAPTVAATRASLRASFGRPEPRSSLLAELRPALRPDERIVETALRRVDRLLLENDPWTRLELAPPSAERRDALLADLRERGLLPAGTPLPALLAHCASLAELQAALAEANVDAIVALVPTTLLLAPGAPDRGSLDPNLRDCAWWEELFEWLRTLPTRAAATSPDGLTAAAILELRAPPR
jgi:hypothetical protein